MLYVLLSTANMKMSTNLVSQLVVWWLREVDLSDVDFRGIVFELKRLDSMWARVLDECLDGSEGSIVLGSKNDAALTTPANKWMAAEKLCIEKRKVMIPCKEVHVHTYQNGTIFLFLYCKCTHTTADHCPNL